MSRRLVPPIPDESLNSRFAHGAPSSKLMRNSINCARCFIADASNSIDLSSPSENKFSIFNSASNPVYYKRKRSKRRKKRIIKESFFAVFISVFHHEVTSCILDVLQRPFLSMQILFSLEHVNASLFNEALFSRFLPYLHFIVSKGC